MATAGNGLGQTDTGLLKLLGIEITEATADRVVLAMTATLDHVQPHGVLHGGIHCTLVETAASVGGHLWNVQHGGSVVGVANQTDFLRPFTTGPLTATATPIHRGRTQQLWLVEIAGEDGRPRARGQVRLQNIALPT